MLFVIPTFNRMEKLRWTLLSLLQPLPAGTGIRICIANNSPETAAQVEKVVRDLKTGEAAQKTGEWIILHRRPALEPVKNWYSAIADHAEKDETVFLHSDDDLLFPRGVSARHEAITGCKADMLLSKTVNDFLMFLPGDRHVYAPPFGDEANTDLSPAEIRWSDIHGWGPALISNHVYRNTERFRRALDLTFKWCHEQDWLDWNMRTLMLPYYLPFAVKQLGGRLFGLDKTCVFRGIGLEEILKAQFGVGWNPGFLSLCAYGVLSNRDMGPRKDLAGARHLLQLMASEWFLTFFFDKRISAPARKETFKRLGLPGLAFNPAALLKGLRLVLLDKLNLRSFRTKRTAEKHRKPVQTFLDLIRSMN